MDSTRIGGLCPVCGLTNLEHAGGNCPIQEDHKKLTVPPPLYAVMYPALVAIARKYGYALAIHGTMTRDFDLVAVPWTAGAEDPFPMIDEMKNSIQAVYSNNEIDYLIKEGNPETKPHAGGEF